MALDDVCDAMDVKLVDPLKIGVRAPDLACNAARDAYSASVT